MYRPILQQIALWPSRTVIRERKWLMSTINSGFFSPKHRQNLHLSVCPQLYFQFDTTSRNIHVAVSRFRRDARSITTNISSAYTSQQPQQAYVMDTCQQLYNDVIDFNNGVCIMDYPLVTSRLDYIH